MTLISNLSNHSLIAIALGFIAGFLLASVFSCTKQVPSQLEIEAEFPIFDLDKIVWEEMTDADFDQPKIGFFRGDSEILILETSRFKDENGKLIISQIATEMYHTNDNRGGCPTTNPCCGDFDCNCFVNAVDLLIFTGDWGTPGTCPCSPNSCECTDISGDGTVNNADLLLFNGLWPSTC